MCYSVYPVTECVTEDGKESKKCSYVEFPNHPHVSKRKECGAILLKKVKALSGNVSFQPNLVYCYKSLIDSLQEMLYRPNFLDMCEEWRSPPGMYNDIYDGKMWKDFQEVNGQPFLSLPYNIALNLNIDWFQPFSHTQHSEGVIYMTVLNLPRKQRYLQENIILVGVIPGPHEPKKLNSFLYPLVNELCKLWQGVVLKTKLGTLIIRAALLCIACDVPATRKVCGFVAHNALHGCSKCFCAFPTAVFGEKPDYTNFDCSTWGTRGASQHKEQAIKHRDCNTRADQKAIEREYGLRYSVLIKLPYFNAPRMCVIDPMHNLFLGTAKHMIEIWKALNILSPSDFQCIQERVDSFVTPTDIGRTPKKIASALSGFTAE